MFGKNLDKLIRSRKTNKTDLCKHLEISRTTLGDYLNERTFMPSDKIEKTATYFEVTVGSLFGESNDQDISLRDLLIDQQRQINEIMKQMKQISAE